MRKVKLSNITEYVRNGKSIKNSSDGAGLPITRIETISDGTFNENKLGYGGVKDLDKIGDYWLQDGDILMSHINSPKHLGKSALYEKNDLDIIHGMNLLGIRPNKSKVLPEFLNYYFLSKDFNSFIKSISNQSVNQASFASSKLKKLRIPLPRLEEQKAIVAKLDRAQRLIDIDKAMLAKYDQLIQSVFLDMFGDPVTNPKGWEIKKLGDVGTLGRGKSKHRPRNDPSILGGKYPLIQTGDVSNAGLFITDYDSTYNEQGLKQSKLWDKGTLCITIAANIAKVGILDFAACFPDSVVGFKSEQASSVFIYSWMGFLQDIIEEQAPVSAQKNINLRILRDLDIIFPPLELQKKYESAVLNIQIEINRVTEVNLKSEELFNSLVEGVFG